MKYFGIIGSVIGSILCLIGTAIGLIDLMHASTAFGYTLSVGIAMMLIIMLLATKTILRGKRQMHTMLRSPWFVAIAAVLFSLINLMFKLYLKAVVTGPSLLDTIVTSSLSCAMVLFLCGSPVYLSHIIAIHLDSGDSEIRD